MRHSFTHFHLVLRVMTAELAQDAQPLVGAFLEPQAFAPSDLPTVMRKAFDLLHADATPHVTTRGPLI